jgi:hypothetical protein
MESNMHMREPIRATITVANTTDMSGRATPDETNSGLRTGSGRLNFWLIACSRFLGPSLTMVALFGALAPMPTGAGEDERGRRGENEPPGYRELAALQAQVAALQSQVNTLQTQLAAVQANNALKLGPFIIFNPDPEKLVRGPNITFSGANIHIVSGSGTTDDNGNLTGLGNLIIGYDEILTGHTDRRGSHNLAIGRYHSFAGAFGGLVVGTFNVIDGEGASVSGGSANIAGGDFSSVSGGASNVAFGKNASVSGGFSNNAGGDFSSISGGQLNLASGMHATISGGQSNTASGESSVVIGGTGVTANNTFSIAPKPPFL